MSNESKWRHHLPLVISTVLVLTTLYMMVWAWSKSASIIATQYLEKKTSYLIGMFGANQELTMIPIFVIGVVSAFGWLLSTRVKFYQSRFMRIFTFVTMLLSIWGVLAAYGMGQFRKRFIPFFQERLTTVIETNGFFESIVFEQTHGFYLMLTMLPMFMMFFITLFVLTKFVRHDTELIEPFFEYEWKGRWLQKFSKLAETEVWPDIELGLDSATREMVVMPGRDRTLNGMIIGAIGTGKTAALALPMLNQDLHHMTRFINIYPDIYDREDFATEDVGGRYVNGISVIDPSNDLCQKTLSLVRAHGIPEEAITYINPLDPDTPSINPMRGPVDKVAEVFAQVIAGLNDTKGGGGNSYFEQAERNHLKHYIYLLKLHEPGQDVTLDMLLDMYNNPQYVRQMHMKLKSTFPENHDNFEDREERNYWKIVQGIDDWFNMNLVPEVDRNNVPAYTDDSEIKYNDAKMMHVQGLVNILNDIGANPLIRRVLFGKSDFDFDRHMAVGGVLLVNTAKGELVNLARVLGKIVLMNLQNATFRRDPNISPFHHVLIDESPDYLYAAFREFPAQSRKYKVILTPLMQTIAQLADQFGEHYMTTLIAAMRNRMVYGDVPNFDAEYFSKMFGDKFVYQEGQTEMAVSPLQEDPMSRSGSSYSLVREQAMTGGDIMYQEAFQCAVKLVINNRPMPVMQVEANFVPKKEFEEAIITVNEESAEVWLRERAAFGIVVPVEQVDEILSVEETELVNEEFYEVDQQSEIIRAEILDKEMMDAALRATVEPKPRDEVIYNEEHTDVRKPSPQPEPIASGLENVEEFTDWKPITDDKPNKADVLDEYIIQPSRPPQENPVTTPTEKTKPVQEPVQPVEQPIQEPEPTSVLDEIVSDYIESPDDVAVDEFAMNYDDELPAGLKNVTEARQSYKESELNEQQKGFFDGLGEDVRMR